VVRRVGVQVRCQAVQRCFREAGAGSAVQVAGCERWEIVAVEAGRQCVMVKWKRGEARQQNGCGVQQTR